MAVARAPAHAVAAELDRLLDRRPPAAERRAHRWAPTSPRRDVWARVLYGARTSIIVGFGAVAIYLSSVRCSGWPRASTAGYVDQGIMRFTDTIMAIPPLLLIIVFVAVIGPSIISVIIVIGLLGWPVTARLVRGQLLVLRESEFITAARVVGVPDRTILLRHMLPNILGPLTVVATFGVATAVLLESSLSFLGLGVRPPEASWGNLITEAVSPVVLTTLPVAVGPGGGRDHHDGPRGQLHRRRPARRDRSEDHEEWMTDASFEKAR